MHALTKVEANFDFLMNVYGVFAASGLPPNLVWRAACIEIYSLDSEAVLCLRMHGFY